MEPYEWCRVRQPGPRLLSDIELCPPDQADLLSCLQRQDADRIELDRSRLFRIKHEIVQHLGTVTAKTNADTLRETCLGLLSQELVADDMQFYLRMDRMYLGDGLRPGDGTAWWPNWSPGGLTNLVEVIGRFEAELRLGTLDSTCQAEQGLLRKALLDEALREQNVAWVYFGLVDHPQIREIDSALDGFISRFKHEPSFWEEYREQLNGSLNSLVRYTTTSRSWPT